MRTSVLVCAVMWMILAPLAGAGDPGPMAATSAADSTAAGGKWGAWSFLLGKWTAIDAPGEGSGWFTFTSDLQGHVLVRRNHAEYPAAKDRPANTHDDLMIVSAGPNGIYAQATYFDSEGHVIRYSVQQSSNLGRLVLVSDSLQPGPRFRLTYNRIAADTVGISFDIAPPGDSNAFKTYLSGKAVRSPEK